MRPSFRVLSGGHAGAVFVPDRDLFIAGRRPEAELRFSRDQDLAVSGRHAAFSYRSSSWYVRDLGSSNGTFVNGSRISAETGLRIGDRIMFGSGGPTVEVRPATAAATTTVMEAGTRRSASQIIAAVRMETRRLRIGAALAVAVVVLVASTLLIADRRGHDHAEAERHVLQERIDSLIQAGSDAGASLQTEVTGLRASLRESQELLQRLRANATDVREGSAEAAELQRQLLSATTALRRQQLAASLDYKLIQQRNRSAVAMVWIEYTDGSVASGTAFGVRSDGTLVTNRHIVTGVSGAMRQRRMAVRFSDSDQAFPARLVSVSNEWDLAAIRVENIIGDVPSVGGLNTRADTLAPGAPIALIGFPLGGEPDDPRENERTARPLVSAGIIISTSPRALEVQGFGAAGGSGSPIIDAAGDVVGVLFGGRNERGVDVLVAVPSSAVNAFLSTVR